MWLKINAIEARVRTQYLQAYSIGQASGIFPPLAYPADVNTKFVGTGRVYKSGLPIKYPDMAITQDPGGMEFLIMEQVQTSPALSIYQDDYLVAMTITVPEGDKHAGQYGNRES